MVFGPIFAILIVDFYFIRNKKYEAASFAKVKGKYWYSNGFNKVALAVWFTGVILFILLQKQPFFVNSIGATYPVIVLTGIIYYFVATLQTCSQNDIAPQEDTNAY